MEPDRSWGSEEIMTDEKAKSLASILGGDVVSAMPPSRSPGVRLALADGRVALLDELAGATYKSAAAVDAFATDGDDRAHVDALAEWPLWGVNEKWATGLAALIGGEAHQSGGNIWVVLFERYDGRFIVVGDDGAELYDSADHYESYYDGNWPEPGFAYWTETTV
jgi:hypothetical protein